MDFRQAIEEQGRKGFSLIANSPSGYISTVRTDALEKPSRADLPSARKHLDQWNGNSLLGINSANSVVTYAEYQIDRIVSVSVSIHLYINFSPAFMRLRAHRCIHSNST